MHYCKKTKQKKKLFLDTLSTSNWNVLQRGMSPRVILWVSASLHCTVMQTTDQESSSNWEETLICLWTPNGPGFSDQMFNLSSKGFALFKIMYTIEISEGWSGSLQMYTKHLVAPPPKSRITGKTVALVHTSVWLKRLQVPHWSSGQDIRLSFILKSFACQT